MRRPRPEKWNIVVDSDGGFATTRIEDVIEAAILSIDDIHDPEFGIDDQGVVTVSIDVRASSFESAVDRAVEVVETAFRRHGVAFPTDHSKLPRR
jgi:hypothetical protein